MVYINSPLPFNTDEKVQAAKAHNCEHLRCRAWGDCYGKGVRCVDCGQEMSRTHEDAKQQSGVGSGDNSTLIEQVKKIDAGTGAGGRGQNGRMG